MSATTKKRTSDDIDPDQEIAAEGTATKKASPADSPVSGPNWSLGTTKTGQRLAYVDSFRGSTLVSIREFYKAADGQMKPGNKEFGIALSLDQFKALRACWDELCAAVDEKTN